MAALSRAKRPRALARLLHLLHSPDEHGPNARSGVEPLSPITVVNLVNGETLPRLTALHPPVRTVNGDPMKAARKAAQAAVTASTARLRLVPSVAAPAVAAAAAADQQVLEADPTGLID
jgi:hypothetical protein